jgi:aquaporin NIP
LRGGCCTQLGAEFVGTFILIFFATAAPIVNQKYGGAISPFGNAACAGLAVATVILSTGHISGAHLNPSLTIAFAALRHFPWLQVPAYVAVQALASVCAAFALKGVFHPFLSGGVTVPDATVSTAQAFFTEFIISFNLLFVVTAVATDTRAVRVLSLSLSLFQCIDSMHVAIDSYLNFCCSCPALPFVLAGG